MTGKLNGRCPFLRKFPLIKFIAAPDLSAPVDYEAKIRERLPKKLKEISFKVDLATQDPRPLNPMAEPGKKNKYF